MWSTPQAIRKIPTKRATVYRPTPSSTRESTTAPNRTDRTPAARYTQAARPAKSEIASPVRRWLAVIVAAIGHPSLGCRPFILTAPARKVVGFRPPAPSYPQVGGADRQRGSALAGESRPSFLFLVGRRIELERAPIDLAGRPIGGHDDPGARCRR